MRVERTSEPLKPVTDVALLGTWTWKPNRIGLDWFAREVIKKLPNDVRVQVGGTGADDLRGRASNLEILGRVPSAADFLGRARCIAIPSLEGAGLQVKTLDALAIGRPVVATSFACRGIVMPEVNVTVADEPSRFAEALVHWVRQPPQRANNDWTRRREAEFLAELQQSVDAF
jgi:glycosyltransferase involved in cell wall biosynthesis